MCVIFISTSVYILIYYAVNVVQQEDGNEICVI